MVKRTKQDTSRMWWRGGRGFVLSLSGLHRSLFVFTTFLCLSNIFVVSSFRFVVLSPLYAIPFYCPFVLPSRCPFLITQSTITSDALGGSQIAPKLTWSISEMADSRWSETRDG